MYTRHIKKRMAEALRDFPIVLINGARQTGKTTMVKTFASGGKVHYETMDDLVALSAAKIDPIGFINRFEKPIVIIDEIQRAPELFLPIKKAVDESGRSGMFILTGSANIFTLPELADSLAGRMVILNLQPLSQGELENTEEKFVDKVFDDNPKFRVKTKLSRDELFNKIIMGGYPRALAASTDANRTLWFQSYISELLERDVRDLTQIRTMTDFPLLLRIIAARSSTQLNLAEISRVSGIQQDTLKRYYSLLHALFLVAPQPAWTANVGRRLTKTAKVILNDTGLITHLLGLNQRRLHQDNIQLGQLLETFVVNELRKQLTWSKTQAQLFHFRDTSGNEVDIVLENSAGEIIGIEVKATSSPRPDDFKGLEKLREISGKRFLRGILIFCGDSVYPFGIHHAIPIQSLWES